jgi:hypothetical protein
MHENWWANTGLIVLQEKLMNVDEHAQLFQMLHSPKISRACFIPLLVPAL